MSTSGCNGERRVGTAFATVIACDGFCLIDDSFTLPTIANMKTCLIANTRSGSWDRWEPELTRLAASTDTPILRESKGRTLSQLLDQARQSGCQRIIVAGGDGSLSRVVNQAINYLDEIELALIPTGTGNDLARSIGVHDTPVENAWNWAVTRPTSAIDLLKVTNGGTTYIVNAATAGFGGIATTDVASEDKQRWGAIAYWMTAFFKMASLPEYKLRLELDSEEVELSTYGLAITNGRFVGGGFPVTPTSVVNDGLLDVAVVGVLPMIDLIAVGVEFALGQYDQPDRVTTFRSSRVKVKADPPLPFSLDGEPAKSIEATFTVLPNALKIVHAPEPPAISVSEHGDKAVV
ncbi:MAG TPA: diacylglycerol kinase family lipid kinase [Pirellulaceae bacterium]|nr:diacylglycerol kinase family lipid kinase [Pirellulaceae bacterium]